jgi:hypothetical protein
MAPTHVRRLVAVAATAAAALAVQVPVHAASGAGTWTAITVPSGRTTVLSGGSPSQMTVAGTASPDVTTVNVYCLRGVGAEATSLTVATSVPVTVGSFQATVPVPSSLGFGSVCRLRALPADVGVHDGYVSSYSGPVLNLDEWSRSTDAGRVFGFFLEAGSGTGEITAAGGGKCASSLMNTVESDLLADPGSPGCMFALGNTDVTDTGSGLVVDGHLSYLPYGEFQHSLPSARELSVSVHAQASGAVTWTESATVERCAGTDQFPPPGSCTSMVSTGVEFRRTGTLLAGGHQVRVRDTFTSTDSRRHVLSLAYGMSTTPPATGGLGYHFPAHGAGFATPVPGQVVQGLGTRAATMLVRSDRFSVEGDPRADTRAITWSRAPSHVAVSPTDVSAFELAYGLTVPKGGSAHLGFADSEAVTTAAASALGARGAADMMPDPRITSPSNHGHVAGTTTRVKGTVRAGANGLPVAVTVNGHRATLTARSGTTATFAVTFRESLGRHTLTAVARDAAGNTRRTSITVTNR